MARFGLPTVLGAGAAGAYGAQQLKENGLSGVWSMLPGSWVPPNLQQAGGSESAQVTALQAELRRLTSTVGDLARRSDRPTVVQVGGKQGWTVIVYPAVVGGAVLFLYCRITGTSVWDLLYVSRSSLTAFRTTVQESMTKVWEEMKKQKEEIFKVVAAMGRKQDELKDNQDALMAKQDQMDERLRRVDDACYQLDAKANHTIQRVEKMDNRLQDVHTGVQAANQGIYMLVSAVSEVTQKIGLHNSRTAQALHRYVTNGPAWQAAAPAPALLEASLGASSTTASSTSASFAAPAPPALHSGASAVPAGPSGAAALQPPASSSVSYTAGVATPGGLRGLMSGGLGNGGGAPTANGSGGGGGLAGARQAEEVGGLGGGGAGAASCRIEDVTEPVGAGLAGPAAAAAAAGPKGVQVGGLGMLRGFN